MIETSFPQERSSSIFISTTDAMRKERHGRALKPIAKELSISDKTVRRATKDLEKAGLSARNMQSEKTARSQATVIFYYDSPRDSLLTMCQ